MDQRRQLCRRYVRPETAASRRSYVLERPRWQCLPRVLWRSLSRRERADRPEGCPEDVSWDFLKFVCRFDKVTLPSDRGRSGCPWSRRAGYPTAQQPGDRRPLGGATRRSGPPDGPQSSSNDKEFFESAYASVDAVRVGRDPTRRRREISLVRETKDQAALIRRRPTWAASPGSSIASTVAQTVLGHWPGRRAGGDRGGREWL
jgi:hypothetical protein